VSVDGGAWKTTSEGSVDLRGESSAAAVENVQHVVKAKTACLNEGIIVGKVQINPSSCNSTENHDLGKSGNFFRVGCTPNARCDFDYFLEQQWASDFAPTDVPQCAFFLSNHASLSGTNGYNILTTSCYMTEISVSSGQTLKIKKGDSIVGDIVIDRRATTASHGRHFYVRDGGSLAVEGVTFTGAMMLGKQGGVAYVTGNGTSAAFISCTFSGNTAHVSICFSYNFATSFCTIHISSS
jgi:hypothetical protein